MRGAEGDSAAEQQRRRESFERSARPLPKEALSKVDDAPIAPTLGSAVEASAVGAAALGFAALPTAPPSCASATLAAAAAATLAPSTEPPALKPAPPRSRSAGPSMSLGSGAGSSGEPPQRWDEQTAEVDEQAAARREAAAERLEGLLYDPIADDAELATADEHEGRGENAEQGESALTEQQLKTAEVVARLEGLLRVRSPTQTSKRLAKLAHITNVNDEYGGETAVLMRGLVVALIYGGLFVSMFAAP